MSDRFDTKKEEAKLTEVREREEEDLARILSEKYDIAYANLSLSQIDTEALRVIPEEDARAAEAVAFAKTAKMLSLAIRNPKNPAVTKLKEELAAREYKVKEFLVSRKSLERALARYADLSFATESKAGVFTVAPEALAKLTKKSTSRSALRAELDNAVASHSLDRVSLVLEALFAGTFALGASDIHLEPTEAAAHLRLRIDGLLSEIYTFDPKMYHQLNSRIKVLSGAKLNVSNRAQDGRFSITKNTSETTRTKPVT